MVVLPFFCFLWPWSPICIICTNAFCFLSAFFSFPASFLVFSRKSMSLNLFCIGLTCCSSLSDEYYADILSPPLLPIYSPKDFGNHFLFLTLPLVEGNPTQWLQAIFNRFPQMLAKRKCKADGNAPSAKRRRSPSNNNETLGEKIILYIVDAIQMNNWHLQKSSLYYRIFWLDRSQRFPIRLTTDFSATGTTSHRHRPQETTRSTIQKKDKEKQTTKKKKIACTIDVWNINKKKRIKGKPPELSQSYIYEMLCCIEPYIETPRPE